jgi:hypothetical protein
VHAAKRLGALVLAVAALLATPARAAEIDARDLSPWAACSAG